MTRVGVCVDIEVGELGEIILKNAIIVADAGRVIDIEGLRAQLEGGFLQAASWTIYEEVHWDRDGITSVDWESYPVIRFDNIPKMDVVVLDVPGVEPVGAGEASPGPTIAAIANALYNATGLRMRRLPFTPDAILRHATSV
jgi:CO/xanthine dehydrogenase Mo-binding subunit